ncbi:MAG: EamA family transporter, partial [Desulfuromusa sp.]
ALHLGIVTAALSYWLFARGLKTVKVGNVATLSLAEPLTASLLGVLVLNEHLGMVEVLGIFLIFSGIVVLAIVPAKRTVDLLHQ